MKRERVDLDHRVLQCFRIGRLTQVCHLPVIAGDSIEISMNGFLRLNPLRRPLAFDLKVDMWGFFNPYRWTYDGFLEEIETQTDGTATTFPANTAGDHVPALLMNCGAHSHPSHRFADYLRVYNQYFKPPDNVDAAGTVFLGELERLFGVTVAPLKTGWTTFGPEQFVNVASESIDSVNSFNVSLVNLTRQRWEEDQLREWTGQRLQDIYKRQYGARIPREVIQEPIFLGGHSRWLSSHDVDGQSGAELGSVVGKVVAPLRWRMPRRFQGEHGTIQVVMVVRPHPVFNRACHYLDRPANFRLFDARMAPPEAVVKKPENQTAWDWFWDGDNAVNMQTQPYLQWYRTHPSFSSSLLEEEDTGWEGRATPLSYADSKKVPSYDDVFQSLAGGHGKVIFNTSVMANRVIGDPMQSVLSKR